MRTMNRILTGMEKLQEKMKVYQDISKVIQDEVQAHLRFSGSKALKEGDEFAVFMNMVTSNKYSYTVLREVFYRLQREIP